MSVLPESMAALPREDVGRSLKMLEDYVRYMGERMEFSVSGLNKSSAGELTALRVPVNRCDKFELRLRGKGPCAILSVQRVFSVGSDVT